MFVELKDYPGYLVTDDGKVISLRRGYWKTLQGVESNHGYLRVNLQRRLHSIHVLVAATFLGPRAEGYQVNHKDGDKFNNSIENLEYVTAAENNQHAYDTGLRDIGEKHPRSKLTDEEIASIRSLKGVKDAKAISLEFGISRRYVSSIWRYKTRVGSRTPQTVS
jgi:hypothetical protein